MPGSVKIVVQIGEIEELIEVIEQKLKLKRSEVLCDWRLLWMGGAIVDGGGRIDDVVHVKRT